MRRLFLVGLTVFALANCNKAKAPDSVAPAAPAAAAAMDDEPGAAEPGGPHGEGRGGHRRFCEGPDAEARIAKMQKCQSEATAACNTKVYGTATPSKDMLCGDKEKMREIWQCVRAQYGDDKEKQRADRKKMRECMGGAE